MNEELKNTVEKRYQYFERRSRKGRAWAGFFLLAVGGLLLLKTLNIIFFPAWFFTWPMFFVVIGLFIGVKHGFRSGFWMLPVLFGALFLVDEADPTMRLDRFIAPIIIMALGLMFLLRPKRHGRRKEQYGDTAWPSEQATEGVAGGSNHAYGSHTTDRRDFVDVTAVFGGVKKNVVSKSFKGGDVVSFMGGAEIDLSQADFNGRITIDATNIFGGTKLIVPSTWDVQSDITAIFGGVDDKRQISGVNMDPNKVLILDGTCMFGGIEIRSF